MDWSRRPYTTQCLFFRDNPTPVTIRWYPVAEGAGSLELPTVINCLEWDDQPWVESATGEVWGAPRSFLNTSSLPYAVDLGPCGDATTFANGEVFNPALPPTIYNEDHFPACCQAIDAPSFGLEIGLEAEPTPITSDTWTCSESVLKSVNESWIGTLPPGGEQWFYFPGTAGTNYRVIWSSTSVNLALVIARGDDPCVTDFQAVIGGTGDCLWWTAPSTTNYHIIWVNVGPSDASFGVTLEVGTCPGP